MQNKIICINCSFSNGTSSKFCSDCGSPLRVRCSSCNNETLMHANFCDQCGELIADNKIRNNQLDSDFRQSLERRQMTIMFCDLRNYTRMSEHLDPEDLRRVIRFFQDSCEAITQPLGGFISRYMGDGILTLFGYPTAHDDDAYRAVKAAIELVNIIPSLPVDVPNAPSNLCLRIGIATGVVVSGDVIGKYSAREQSIVGITPNLASRLQEQASTNSILVSETTYKLVKNRVDFNSTGPLKLKGIDEPTNAYEVSFTTTPNAHNSSNLFPIVGRDKEISDIEERMVAVSSGGGDSAIIEGEAGIGKSRLIQECKTNIASSKNVVVLEVRCLSYLRNSALHPFFDFLGETAEVSLCGPFKQLVETYPSIEKNIRDQVTQIIGTRNTTASNKNLQLEMPIDRIINLLMFMSEQAPLLFILEDLHWADPSTLQLMDRLTKKITNNKILVLMSCRSSNKPSTYSFEHIRSIFLDKLTHSDSMKIVKFCAVSSFLPVKLQKVVLEKSDGVPLFIEELTQSVLERQRRAVVSQKIQCVSASPDFKIPDTLRDSLMERLDQLGEAKLIAQLAAVIGREFSFELLRVIADIQESNLLNLLSRLVASQLVFVKKGSNQNVYSFKHSLIQDTAYDTLVNTRRAEIHGRIAMAMERYFPMMYRARPEIIAAHYAKSEQLLKAINYLNIASESALQQSANIEALHHANEGLKYLEKLSINQQSDELSLSLYLHQIAALSGTKGDAIPELEEVHRRATEISHRVENKELIFQLTNRKRAYYHMRGPLSKAIELGEQLVDMAKSRESEQLLIDSRRCLGWSQVCYGQLLAGRQLILDSLSDYDKRDTQEHTRYATVDPGGVGTINLAWTEWLAGNVKNALRLVDDAIALSRDINHPYTLSYSLCMGAAVNQCVGDYKRVLSLVEEALKLAQDRDYQYWIAWGRSLRGWAYVRKGQTSEGITELKQGLGLYRGTGVTLFEPHILCMLSESLLSLNMLDEANELLLTAEQVERKSNIFFFAGETQRLLGRAASEMGDVSDAESYLRRSIIIGKKQRSLSFLARTEEFIPISIVADRFNLYEKS